MENKTNKTNVRTEAWAGCTGWIREGSIGRWVLFCRGETEEDCWGELLWGAPSGADKLVRRGDADPNLDRRPR